MSHPHAGHRQRMRARYRKQGLDGFHEHEVLEMLLYYCYPRGDTNEIAHRMLKEFGSLHNLLDADIETLMSTLKCTEKIAMLLNFIPALSNRYFLGKWSKGVVLDDAQTAGQYLTALFVGHKVESVYVLCLDKSCKLINTTKISEGTPDQSVVYTRDVARVAIQNKATGIILAHNHPGGTIRPSRADIEITRRIAESTELIDIDLRDHIIVAGENFYSFASRRQYVKGYP